MLVWSMCEWSGFYNTGMCECLFGQCASGEVFTTLKCASACLVNVRVVRFLQHWNVRVLVWSMCEWSGFYNTGMCECLFGQCASGEVFTTLECASACLVNVRVVRS